MIFKEVTIMKLAFMALVAAVGIAFAGAGSADAASTVQRPVAAVQVQPAHAYECDPYGNCWAHKHVTCTPWWQWWSSGYRCS